MGVIDCFFLTITTTVSVFTHLFMLGLPSSVVFDEVYFGNFTHYYHRGQYFFDIHPPLGKELLYLGSKLSGYRYAEVYSEIGAPLAYSQIRRLRFWPSFMGSLRAPLMFLAFEFMGVSAWWSLAFGLFVATDQALIAESRYVLIDAYLSMFAALTIFLTAVIARRIKSRRLLVLAIVAVGVAAGCTVSVKFTGGGVALTVVAALVMHYPSHIGLGGAIMAGICGVVVLMVSFVVHFSLLTRRGPGCPYHELDFCLRLERGELSVFQATIDLIPRMLASNLGIVESHSYSSPWWSWPLLAGLGTYLWVKDQSQTWTIGSPIVWWGGTLGLVVWTIAVFKNKKIIGTVWVIFGWAISYLPFAFIRRVMWNYHYFIPLLYSLGAAAVAANAIAPKARLVPLLLILGAFGCWWLYLPVTYGTPIAHDKLKKRMLPWWTY
jgi:dolichyl-phosphate-mannose-protein mannosyltransferase